MMSFRPARRPWPRRPRRTSCWLPTLVLDFLCIHPFRDGNGRVARLQALLTLYHHGHEMGRYVSLERRGAGRASEDAAWRQDRAGGGGNQRVSRRFHSGPSRTRLSGREPRHDPPGAAGQAEGRRRHLPRPGSGRRVEEEGVIPSLRLRKRSWATGPQRGAEASCRHPGGELRVHAGRGDADALLPPAHAGLGSAREELAGPFFFLDHERADGSRESLGLGDHSASVERCPDRERQDTDVNTRGDRDQDHKVGVGDREHLALIFPHRADVGRVGKSIQRRPPCRGHPIAP